MVSDVSISEYRDWLVKRGRERSATKYERVARQWLENPDVILAKITSSSYSPSYRRNLVAAVRSFARFAGDSETLDELDDLRLPAPVPQDHREPYSREQWLALITAIEESDLAPAKRATCWLIARRGIRCGDVLRFRRRHVLDALDGDVMSFESKGQRWQHYSAAPLRPALEIFAEQDGWKRVRNLICPRSPDDIAQESAGRAVRAAFDRIAAGAGLRARDVYPHLFRHTYATRFLQQMAGDPEALVKLQSQMGWARLDTAANYLRRSRRDELDAVDSELFDE